MEQTVIKANTKYAKAAHLRKPVLWSARGSSCPLPPSSVSAPSLDAAAHVLCLVLVLYKLTLMHSWFLFNRPTCPQLLQVWPVPKSKLTLGNLQNFYRPYSLPVTQPKVYFWREKHGRIKQLR